MKLRIVGIDGVCDAALIRAGNSSDMIVRILVPAAYGTVEEVFAGPAEFRNRCKVHWTASIRDGKDWDELRELQEHGFVD